MNTEMRTERHIGRVFLTLMVSAQLLAVQAHAEALLLLAYARRKNGQEEASEETLLEAARLSAHFDSAPAYSLKSMRFIEQADYSSLFDVLGATAAESIGSLLTLLDDPDFTEKWKEISSREQ